MTREMGMRRLARTGFAVGLGFLMLGLAAALTAPVAAVQAANLAATRTTLTAETQEIGGKTVTAYSATVRSDEGSAATGAVTLMEQDRALAGAALDSEGNAEIRFDSLSAGEHTLYAVFAGDATHAASKSEGLSVRPEAAAASDFALAIAVVGSSTPGTMTIATPGQSGSLVATVTPTADSGFTGFISLSCSGPPVSSGAPGGTNLPIGVSCTFTPANLQVTSAKAVSADMGLQTAASQQTVAQGNFSHGKGAMLALAILLPGILGLGYRGLGYVGRKRKLFARMALLALVGAIGVLGTTSCAARYKYLNHGPVFTGTLPGTYTLTITAQTSNGVTASSQSQTLTLVVQ